jgi:hypothetical protein
MTYLYRSILTPIQFDDPLLLVLSIAKQITVMHSAMLPVLTLSPLAQEKAVHLLGSAGERGPLRGSSQRSPICGFCRAPWAISVVIATDLLPAHAWDALAKSGRW